MRGNFSIDQKLIVSECSQIDEILTLTWYGQCNFITGVWVSWSLGLVSSTAVITRVRFNNRTDSVFLWLTDMNHWIIFIPAVDPAADVCLLYDTCESDRLSSEHTSIRLNTHYRLGSLCVKLI